MKILLIGVGVFFCVLLLSYIGYWCHCKLRAYRSVIVINKDKKNQPIVVTKGNFGDFQRGTYILLFLASWCGHCHQFKESTNNFREFVEKYPGKLLVIDPYEANIDGLMERTNIRGFPAITVMTDGKIKEHMVTRSNESLIKLYESQIMDLI